MIYPIPQKMNLTGRKIAVTDVCFLGDCVDTARKIAEQYDIKCSDGFNVNIKISDNKKTTYIDELSKINNEKYYITINVNSALIEASSKRGVFRAVHTLMKLIEKNELSTGEIEDYPLFETRGYIEGFYGATWEEKKRLSVMSLMAKYGMNTFYYAPKDDEFHREKWREEYPEKEYNELKTLFNFAKDNEFDFCWCIGPGLTYHYTDNNDFRALIHKIKSVYSIGIRRFGLLLDDIPYHFQYEDDKQKYDSIVDAHINLIRNTYDSLKSFDSNISLTVCPTEYFGDERGYYIQKLGQNIPSDIKLFWTGQEICSRVLTCRESDDFLRSTSHRPLFWDNYPVNDCEMFQEMHLGALTGRDTELYKHCDGLISNVMEYAECSKIPLMTIADYLWNPTSYNSENSLKNAQKEVLGDKAELFKYIADHLCVSCLNRHGSQLMSETLSHISFLTAIGKEDEAVKEFTMYLENMRLCLEMLRDTTVELFNEIQKWVDKFELTYQLLDAVLQTQISPTDENKAVLRELLEKHNRDAVILAGFSIREAAEKALKL